MPEYRVKLYRGKFYAVWTDEQGRTKRRALRTEDGDEAQRRIIQFRREIAAPEGSTVGEIVEAYLNDKEGRIVDVQRLRFAWDKAEPTFGPLLPAQITRDLCREYTAMRRGLGKADGTIIKEINVVRQALNWKAVQGASFEAPSAPLARDRHLTREEFQQLLAACVQPHVRLYTILALSTAARKSALLDLTWDRVDFRREQIRLTEDADEIENDERDVMRKRKRRAIVPMTSRARIELEAAKEVSQTPYVIEYAGKKVANIKKGFMGAVKRAKLHDVTPHDLRHTAAVWMAENGVSMDEIAQFLGHTDPRITFQVYARFSPSHLKKAAQSLEF